MYPILTRYGSFFLYSYTVVMGVGLLVAVGVAVWENRRKGLGIRDWGLRGEEKETGRLETERLVSGGRATGGGRRSTRAVWLDGVIWALLVGLVVGRVAFVAVNWAYFRA